MREYRNRTDDPSKVPEVIQASGEYKKLRRIASNDDSHTERFFSERKFCGCSIRLQEGEVPASPQNRCDYTGAMHNAEGL